MITYKGKDIKSVDDLEDLFPVGKEEIDDGERLCGEETINEIVGNIAHNWYFGRFFDKFFRKK